MSDIAELRTDLAAAFRWAARLDLHEGVANHFSVAADDGRFLINPAGRHFSTLCGGDLLLADGAQKPPREVDPTAWCLHSYLHNNVAHARCILHSHAPNATALASLDGWRMQSIDQNSCRFHNRIAYDETFGGMLLATKEAARQAAALGDKKVLVMRGHGILTAGDTVADAFDGLYYFERACLNQRLALSTNRPLFWVDDETAEKTARQWEDYDSAQPHFAALKKILDKEEPDYRN